MQIAGGEDNVCVYSKVSAAAAFGQFCERAAEKEEHYMGNVSTSSVSF